MNILAPIPGRTNDLERTQIGQRQWMALLAAMLPIAFLTSSFILNRTEFQSSMSAYYWTRDVERNIFLGVLFFIAAYLLLYKGYTLLQDRALNLAGVSAAVAGIRADESVRLRGSLGPEGVLHGRARARQPRFRNASLVLRRYERRRLQSSRGRAPSSRSTPGGVRSC